MRVVVGIIVVLVIFSRRLRLRLEELVFEVDALIVRRDVECFCAQSCMRLPAKRSSEDRQADRTRSAPGGGGACSTSTAELSSSSRRHSVARITVMYCAKGLLCSLSARNFYCTVLSTRRVKKTSLYSTPQYESTSTTNRHYTAGRPAKVNAYVFYRERQYCTSRHENLPTTCILTVHVLTYFP